MSDATAMTTSKYCKVNEDKSASSFISAVFLFSLFVMPQYFGLPTPGFDFTILRIMIVVMLFLIFDKTEKKKQFGSIIIGKPYARVWIPYLVVISYTMILRTDINAFLNPFIEIVCYFLLIYIIKFEIGFEKTFKLLRVFSYLLVILGIIEFFMNRSPFSYLEVIKGVYTGRFIRSGNYRIMGPAVHSLGYGLMLMCFLPFVCYDEEKREISLFNRPFLLLLLLLNVFFTGSRSTLGVFLLEMLVLIFLCSKQTFKRTLLQVIIAFIVFMLFEIAIYKTSMGQYIMLQITSVMDEVLGTEYSVAYGADVSALGSSSNYREQLKGIFKIDWLNPLVGLGRNAHFSAEINGSYVKSVDDFYICEYLRYAYPGLFSYALILIFYVFSMWKKGVKGNCSFVRVVLVTCLAYLLNLKWVDSLQTLKYLYVLFALFVSVPEEYYKSEGKQICELDCKSKYIKRDVKNKKMKNPNSKYFRKG